MAYLLTISPARNLGESFDASVARRLSLVADDAIPRLIHDKSV